MRPIRKLCSAPWTATTQREAEACNRYSASHHNSSVLPRCTQIKRLTMLITEGNRMHRTEPTAVIIHPMSAFLPRKNRWLTTRLAHTTNALMRAITFSFMTTNDKVVDTGYLIWMPSQPRRWLLQREISWRNSRRSLHLSNVEYA